MDTNNTDYNHNYAVDCRQLLDALYNSNKISRKLREDALDFIYPHSNCGLWVSRFLFAIGSFLILSGILCFCVFNWSSINYLIKLFSIEMGVVLCVLYTYFRSLDRVSSQFSLLASSVLIGVFMVVFGQSYQTGADSYQLFMAWTILTIVWTIVSNFAAQWIFWIIIANIFLMLGWKQLIIPTRNMESMIFVYLIILNGFFWYLREYFVSKKFIDWLKPEWTRVVIATITLIMMFIPVVDWILKYKHTTDSLNLGAVFGAVGHFLYYFTYRYIHKNLLVLALTILSGCIIIELSFLNIILKTFNINDESSSLMIMTILTIVVFSFSVIHLRNIFKYKK